MRSSLGFVALCVRAAEMPRITKDQKHHVSLMLNGGCSHSLIRHETGPSGKFPLSRKPISAGSIVNLSRRIRDHGDVHYRKRRVDGTSITLEESVALDGMMTTTGTMYTEELTRGLEEHCSLETCQTFANLQL